MLLRDCLRTSTDDAGQHRGLWLLLAGLGTVYMAMHCFLGNNILYSLCVNKFKSSSLPPNKAPAAANASIAVTNLNVHDVLASHDAYLSPLYALSLRTSYSESLMLNYPLNANS